MVSPVLFWFVAFITVLPALALIFARRPVYIAVAVVLVMVGLAVAYVALGAPFLGVVQIVVYTGAVMMLFVFVLMLVGVDKRENLKETINSQRWIALTLALGVGTLLISVVSQLTFTVSDDPTVGEPAEVAVWLFGEYVLVVEVLGFLLITAAVGALVLTHVPRLFPKRTQAEIQTARVAAGADPVNKAFPGVYARHNALDAPALDPDGNPVEDSVSRVLKVRHQTIDGSQFKDDNKARRRELGAKEDDA
jgi:NADH-quinone oxidoreductase subunit J